MKLTLSDRLFSVFVHLFVSIFALFCLLPFMLMISGSITEENDLIANGYTLIPKHISWEAYQVTFQSNKLLHSYSLSIFITVVGTAAGLTISAMLANSIANKRNVLRHPMAFFVSFLMLFNGGLIPFYLLVSKWLNLYDTVWALIVPYLVQPFLVFLMISFFRNLPDELEEAALVDGAGEFRIFFQIVLPVAKPILATVALFLALSYWNDWLLGLLFAGDERLYPLQLILRRMISNLTAASDLVPSGISIQPPSMGIRMATTVVTIGPIIFLYPLLQRYFVKGITVGAIKG